MPVISLLTDFGDHDGYPAMMKGVIWGINPSIQVADISHTVRQQDIRHGALVLSRAYSFFPSGSVHVAVVDPGVGTQRRPLAARLGEHYFVLPDNGLITMVFQTAKRDGKLIEIIHLNQAQYWLPEISNVFHGRDIFAPSAAYLASGVPLANLGSSVTDPILLEIFEPQPTINGWIGHVIDIDHFGNLITDLEETYLKPAQVRLIHCKQAKIDGLVQTFGAGKSGELIAFMDSDKRLSIAVVNGSAAALLDVVIGDPVEVVLAQKSS